MRAAMVCAGLLASVLATGGVLPATAGTEAQVVTSTEGAYAKGLVTSARFPDGRDRSISVLMGVPAGIVAGSPAAGSADLTKPWVALRVTSLSDALGLAAGSGCAAFSNPSSWSAPQADGRGSFAGMHAVVSCPNDPVYSSYTIRFAPAIEWGRPAPVFEYRRPALNTEVWGSGLPSGVGGNVVAEVRMVQTSYMYVCGARHGGGVDCYGGKEGMSNVYPHAGTMVAKLNS